MKAPIVFAWDIAKKPHRPILYGFGPSPFGMAIVAVDEIGLCGLGFGLEESTLRTALLGGHQSYRDDVVAAATLKTIFETGGALAVHLTGTPWQIAVWQALCAIPDGTVTSYGALARTLGHPMGARAVGAALRANPVAWLVPCHRVVGKDGSLTGFRWGLSIKRTMLATEGVMLNHGASP